MYNYRNTYYEVIESFPSILKAKIPLIQILMGTIYYILLPIAFIIVFIKRGFSLFSRIDITKGAEKTTSETLDMETYETIEFNDGDVIETDSFYYSAVESIEIREELELKGYDFSKISSKNFRIKKRIEICHSNEEKEDRVIVAITVPKIAKNIYTVFHTLRLV